MGHRPSDPVRSRFGPLSHSPGAVLKSVKTDNLRDFKIVGSNVLLDRLYRRRSTLSQRHDRVRHRRQCQALSGGGARSVSRFVVGWAISAVNARRFTLKALEMAARGAVPLLDSCNTRIEAAPTRATTTKRISPAIASPAA